MGRSFGENTVDFPAEQRKEGEVERRLARVPPRQNVLRLSAPGGVVTSADLTASRTEALGVLSSPEPVRASCPRTHADEHPHTHEIATGKGLSAVSSVVGRSCCHINHVTNVSNGACHAERVAPLPWAAPHTPPRSLPARLCPPCSPSVLAPRPLPVGTCGLMRPDAPTPAGTLS